MDKCHYCDKEINGDAISNELYASMGYYFCCVKCAEAFTDYIETNK